MRPTMFQLPSPLGPLLVEIGSDGVCALEFESERSRMRSSDAWDRVRRSTAPPGKGGEAEEVARRLRAYFSGDLRAIDGIVASPAGTPFQRLVWAALRTIPAGRTLAYRDLAAAIGRPSAVRAVGLANGSNPIAIVVPCHRVIGADGRLTGYGGGLWRKEWLLRHEGAPFVAPRALRPRQATLPLRTG